MTIWVIRSTGVSLQGGRHLPPANGRLATRVLFSGVRSQERTWPRELGGARAVLMGRPAGESPSQGDGPGSVQLGVPLRSIRRIRRTT